jgi:sugar lactone lactonase YvrE
MITHLLSTSQRVALPAVAFFCLSGAGFSQEYLWKTFAGNVGGPGFNDGTGVLGRFNFPAHCAVDAAGNIYIADQQNHTIRKVTPAGDVTTLAGRPLSPGSANGTGDSARFSSPAGIAVDSNGMIYVADTDNHAIRRITPAGLVSTFAGMPGQSGSGDGVGSAARFFYPYSVAFDGSGNMFVADTGNDTIRKITAAGTVTTFAGLAGEPGSANGTGGAARFNNPVATAVDAAGTVYVAENSNHMVRRITSAGVVSNFAGSAGFIGSVDGTGSAARFEDPRALAVDAAGNVYVADSENSTIRRITPARVVTTFAGTAGNYGFEDGVGAAAKLHRPRGLAVTPAGDLYVMEYNNQALRKVTPARVVTTIAGGPRQYGPQDGTGTAARFYNPGATAVDANGNVFVADTYNNTIRKITPEGVVTTIAGEPGVTGSNDGTGSAARFYSPSGIVVAPDGELYVADGGNDTIRRVTQAGVVTTWAGRAGSEGSLDGTGSSARFYRPTGIEMDSSGNIYVADKNNFTIRKITPGGSVSTLAGSPGNSGSNDGTGSAARFYDVNDVTVDPAGNIYVADSANHLIRRVTPAGVVTTFAGSAGQAGTSNGTGSAARFNRPEGITLDKVGNLFVLEMSSEIIRKITPARVVTTVGGVPGGELYIGEGVGTAARFLYGGTMSTGPDGTLYVADSGNHRIMKGVPFLPEIKIFDGMGGTAPEILDGQTAPVDFGTTRVGVPETRTVTVSNAGVAPLRWNGISIPSGYTAVGLPAFPAVLEAGQSLQFDIRFNAATPGVITGRIFFNNSDSDESNFDFPLTGLAVTPEISLHDGDAAAPELVDGQTIAVEFGRNIQGTPAVRTFSITNAGSAELLVSSITPPAGYTLLNPSLLPFIVGAGQSNSIRISLSTLMAGSHSGSVVVASDDLDEAAFDFPITGEVFIPDPVATVPSDVTTILNRQTGLREQSIHLTNDTTATVPAYNLIIRGLPEGVEVNNASGRRADGSWVVYVRQAMNPHSVQDILLEYFSANRGPGKISPQLSTEVVLNPPDLSVPGDTGFAIDRVLLQQGGAVLIEFPTTPGRQYQVQYSHGGTNWQASLPAIRAVANRTQWLDRGLPRTDSHPSAHASRFYRVAELAP